MDSLPPTGPDHLTTPHADGWAHFAPGELLAGRYRIVARLGAGGMGEVYRADDLTLAQPVALKFLARSASSDPAARDRFRSEVRAARQVSHAHVCRVHDIGEHLGLVFLTMEFVDGEDLVSLLRRVGRLAEERAIVVARDLCSAVQAVHEQGLLHRDLKPANVMLDGRGKVKLTDFGIAALAGQAQDVRSGTAAYQAPEVLAGREVSARSDLYALGLVLYELFTGKPAYPATSREALQRAQNGPPTPLSSHVSSVEPGVERVILRCLEHDPAKRPRSADEVLASLPGGDALRAALAAGEVPSPALVADAGGIGTIHVWQGLSLLAAVLVGMGLFAWTNDHTSLHRLLPMKPPYQLRAQSLILLESLGYDSPKDSAEGFLVDQERLQQVVRTQPSKEAWSNLSAGQPPVLFYWYRHSEKRLVHRLSPNDIMGYGIPGLVTINEPAIGAGDACVILDGAGKLIELHARPAWTEETNVADWEPLFQAAGLARSERRPTPPQRDPGVHATDHLAWIVAVPDHPEQSVRVEAAARKGRPVYFHIGDEKKEDRLAIGPVPPDLGTELGEWVYGGIRLLALTLGAFLAWRNVRSGVAHARGATRVAQVCAASYLLMWLLMANHVGSLADEWAILAAATGNAFLNGVTLWVIYLALEPYVRRLQPEWVIGWNRILAGRLRDPLVGRDILIGGLLGVLWALLLSVRRSLLPQLLGEPYVPNSVWMPTLTTGPLGPLIGYIWFPVFIQLLEFFLLVLVYLTTRRLGPAIALWGLFIITRWALYMGTPLSVQSGILTAVGAGLAGLALLRFGLLAFVAFGTFAFTLADLPITADWRASYFPTSLCTLGVLGGLAAYGCATALPRGWWFDEDAAEPSRPTVR